MRFTVAPFLGIGHVDTPFAGTPATVASPIVVVVMPNHEISRRRIPVAGK